MARLVRNNLSSGAYGVVQGRVEVIAEAHDENLVLIESLELGDPDRWVIVCTCDARIALVTDRVLSWMESGRIR